jgi:hypothetical protein
VGISYFLGAEIAHPVGAAGTKAIIALLAVVAAGLGIGVGYALWRSAHDDRHPAHSPAR